MKRVGLFIAIILMLSTSPLWADVKLPAILGDNMVLQQNTDVTIWGLAQPGENIRFAIADKDRQFVWADAEIDGLTVLVSSDKVKEPVAVRYAWDVDPETSLYNAANLPASPFRTDDWKSVVLP